MIMARRSTYIMLFAVTAAGLAGCGSESIEEPGDSQLPAVCNSVHVPGINLSIINSVTSESLSCETQIDVYGDDLEVDEIYFSQDYCDASDMTSIGIANETPGAFQVIVSREGFQTWTSEIIEVVRPDGECHVITNLVTAELVPSQQAAD